jgi:predicted ATPase
MTKFPAEAPIGKDIMLTVQIENCNNIISGSINVTKDYLNIFYAMNGMGKSTIAKTIALIAENGDMSTDAIWRQCDTSRQFLATRG